MKNVFKANLKYIKGTQDEFLVELTGALAVDQSCLKGSSFFMQLSGQDSSTRVLKGNNKKP